MYKYDYLVVGSGLFGMVFAHQMKKYNKKCLIIEKRNLPGGNIRCEERDGINIHLYGAHILHTNSEKVWNFLNSLIKFNNYINSPLANYNNKLYNLPFNMNTFYEMWNVLKPDEAKKIISEQCKKINYEPTNLEEKAISLVGYDIYEKLIKGYTEKQWGRKCTELPVSIITRLPLRFTFDNNYFNDVYQGIPIGGYNCLIKKLLAGTEVKCNVDFKKEFASYKNLAKKIVYTGALDEYYDYIFGCLEYRSLSFVTKCLEIENYQGVAVMNFTSSEIPYTRIIEHKHFEFGKQKITYITYEYPKEWKLGDEPFYSINDQKNQILYEKYANLALKESNLILGGRMALYKYYDMDKVIEMALDAVDKELE